MMKYPAWSPDGGRLALVSFRDGNSEIYAVNADGSGVTRLTDHPAWDAAPGATSYEMQRCVDSGAEKTFVKTVSVEETTSLLHMFPGGAITFVVAAIVVANAGEILLSDQVHHARVSTIWFVVKHRLPYTGKLVDVFCTPTLRIPYSTIAL